MSDQSKLPIETPLEWLHFAEGDFRVAEREGQTETPVFPAEAEETLKSARAFRDRVAALMAKKEEPKA